MSTASGQGSRSDYASQMKAVLQQAGATIVVRCPTCLDYHSVDACPYANAGASTPFVAAITPRDEGIVDGVGYEGREKPEFVRRDDEGWRTIG